MRLCVFVCVCVRLCVSVTMATLLTPALAMQLMQPMQPMQVLYVDYPMTAKSPFQWHFADARMVGTSVWVGPGLLLLWRILMSIGFMVGIALSIAEDFQKTVSASLCQSATLPFASSHL